MAEYSLLRGSLMLSRKSALVARRIALMAKTSGTPLRKRVTCSLMMPPTMGAMASGIAV